MKAIREYCVADCANGHPGEVRKCSVADCKLFHYRMGRNPARCGISPGLDNFRRAFNKKNPTQCKILKGKMPE